MRTLLAAQVFTLVTVPCLAQGRVWTVDAANGPGTDFLDLPPAVAAAVDGDVVRIRSGTYSAISTGKALALVGTAGVVVQGAFAVPPVDVVGLPARGVFAMRDVTLAYTVYAAAVFRQCAGAVVLQNVNAQSTPPWSASIAIENCAGVVVDRCGIGTPNGLALTVHASKVAISGCVLRGQGAVADPRVGSAFSAPGLLVVNGSQVSLGDTTASGGGGVHEWPFFGNYRPSAPGLRVVASDVTIARGCAIAAGTGATLTQPVSAIDGNGTVHIDPAVSLTPYAAAPPIGAGITVQQRAVAGLGAAGGELGANVQLTLRSEPGTPFVLGVATAAPPLATPFGNLFLDPGSLLVLLGGNQAATGTSTFVVPLPADPHFFGLPLVFQAAAADLGGRVDLTNATAIVAR